MTAYEVTQDLLDATTAANPAAAAAQPRKRSGLVRFRAAITGGVAAGALLLAAPVAGAATVPAGPPHSVVAAEAESTLPTSITLTTRRTGSVVR